ncbi:zinc finger MYM-type protein 1-like, partial [Aphis craccivora]
MIKSDTGVTSEIGCNDWKNLTAHLRIHEMSKTHILYYTSWQEMVIRLKLNQTIDSYNQQIINSESKRWRVVLVRLCAILRCMAAQNLAFRGTSSVIYSPHNGNFLKLIECFSLFDNVLKNHLEKIKNKEQHVHYLGPQIQNELISLMSEKVKSNILTMIKDVKYYSIILDCTPDCSHREQMSIMLRFVSTTTGNVHEHFIGFIEVFVKTGAGLSERIIKELMDLEININDMRGQSYDNGSNMRGKQNGVQKRILNINPRAFYVPCNSHSLNLVINDAAKCNVDAISFFGIVQKLYVFFSASTDRRKILVQYLPKLTLKRVCDTRWESRIDAIRPIRYQFGEIYDALLHIKEDTNLIGSHGLQTKSDACALLKNICDFKFVSSVIVWYDILSAVNPIS